MKEETFYIDEGYGRVTAASVGISSQHWTSISEADISEENARAIMKENRYDVLPIVGEQGITEFFETAIANEYDVIVRKPIDLKKAFPLDTSIREIIKGFSEDKKAFYFLTYQDRVSGIVTLGNLNCRQVQIYIFGLICELERTLSEFVETYLGLEKIELFVKEKAGKESKGWVETWGRYQKLVQEDLENKITEHLYLSNLFAIVEKHDIFKDFGYSKNQWKGFGSINNLRNSIAHPTRNLLTRENETDLKEEIIGSLWGRIKKSEELTFRIKQVKAAL